MATPIETLTEEQRAVIDFLIRGDNVFLTGPGGVGKSYLLGILFTEFPGLARRYRQTTGLPKICMTAMTGCASLLLGHGAKTLHSWTGIGLGKGTIPELYSKIRRNRKAMTNWLSTDLLVIDEASMLTAELFDTLEELARKVRMNTKFFGGIQLLCCGDMMQLPPIGRDQAVGFVFEGRAWGAAQFQCIELTILQRQKDAAFQKILGEARMGTLSAESVNILRSREGLDWDSGVIVPTIVLPRRATVDAVNDAKLRELTGERHLYAAKLSYDGKIPIGFTEKNEEFQRVVAKMDSEAAYLITLELAVGAQVMLLCNAHSDKGLVNGSRGVVIDFCSASGLPIVQFMNGTKLVVGTHGWEVEDHPFVSRVQVPLRLAYAATTHKLQGASLDVALVDLGTSNFEYGQSYVTLSRVRTLEGLYVMDVDPTSFKAHPKAKAFYGNMLRATMDPMERDRIRELCKDKPPTEQVWQELIRTGKGITFTKLELLEEDIIDPTEVIAEYKGKVAQAVLTAPAAQAAEVAKAAHAAEAEEAYAAAPKKAPKATKASKKTSEPSESQVSAAEEPGSAEAIGAMFQAALDEEKELKKQKARERARERAKAKREAKAQPGTE